MDAALDRWNLRKHALLVIALTPIIPQLLGSAFNIWYNVSVVDPLLATPELKRRFVEICGGFNLIAYPVATYVWLRCVYSLGPAYLLLRAQQPVAAAELSLMRRRMIQLPWWGALISAAGWLLGIPVFLLALWQVGHGLDGRMLWHLPISFGVAGFISITHSFFLVEMASHWALYPVFFRDARADQTPGVFALSIRARGLVWAVSAGICPIGSLLLLFFAPPAGGSDPRWFAVFVGTVGIVFGLCTAAMITGLLAQPIDHLRLASKAVSEGRFDHEIPLRRADEFGLLIEEFNQMIRALRDKERLRQTFGLHVGHRAAEHILTRDPGLGGVEQEITVVFVDIRSFTQRAAASSAAETVQLLNDFLGVMVRVVEEQHGGMVNKFLGDGFIALFGVGAGEDNHAATAVSAGRAMLVALDELNTSLTNSGREPIAIGIGIHTGPAVVGSIGSPQRMEFTAIGSTVNLASRIESLTKSLGTALLITEETRHHLEAIGDLQIMPLQDVRGVEHPVRVFGLAKQAVETAVVQPRPGYEYSPGGS